VRRTRQLAVRWLAMVALVAVACPGTAGAQTVAPAGFTATVRETPAAGVEHVGLVRADPPLQVHVARISPGAAVSLRAVLSNDRVAGPDPQLERTSAMCARVHCVIGINADFGVDQPLGALVTDGRFLRSPSPTHHQLSVTSNGALEDDALDWSGQLLATDLQGLRLDGVNVPRPPDRVILYTPTFGPSTQTEGPGTDLVVHVMQPTGEFRLGQTALVELVSLADGVANSPIPLGGAVLSGQGAGAEALRRLWQRVGAGAAGKQAFLRLDSDTPVIESVGGSPILIKDGRRWFTDPGDDFTGGRHPRTLVGWTPGGDVLLVTVDGRQAKLSVGMTLYEAADLLLSLGATEGINLDGGGSTTFVTGTTVVNHPSDALVRRGGEEVVRHAAQPGDTLVGHVERPVASALVVVASNPVSVPPVDPLAGPSLDLPQAVALPVGMMAAGSLPDGGLPALVSRNAPGLRAPVVRMAMAVDVFVGCALFAVTLVVRRRRY
jgi:Phosphodiester glycosidase